MSTSQQALKTLKPAVDTWGGGPKGRLIRTWRRVRQYLSTVICSSTFVSVTIIRTHKHVNIKVSQTYAK